MIQDISAELENAKLPPEALIVELTESALLEDNSNARHFLKELRKAGIRLALDDFGTGYSNFHYLNELRPDIIKIDRSFTAKAIKDAKEYDLLKRFCTMIHRLNIKICIEGVETEDEWEKIRLMDPDYSQGYLWGKPCSFDELLQRTPVLVKPESLKIKFPYVFLIYTDHDNRYHKCSCTFMPLSLCF